MEKTDKTPNPLLDNWETPHKIAPFDIENEIFLSLSLNTNERCVEIKTKCKKFLNCIDGVNINNPI